MNVLITGRHFDVTNPIKEHAEAKISKLEKFFLNILEAHVILSVEKYRHIAEITLIGKNLKVTAKETTSDMYASIDKTVQSLDKQLRKYSDRIKGHRMKEGHKIKIEAVRAALTGLFSRSDSAGNTPQKIVETKRLIEKPMSTEEAVEELKISAAEFLVFRNSEDDRVNVIYKRKDGAFGLIKT